MPCIEAMDKNVLAFKGILLRWHTHTHTHIYVYMHMLYLCTYRIECICMKKNM